MHQGIITIGMLAGGLGLFLLAVNMITDGLTQAAGHALRDMLGKWTSTLGRGIIRRMARQMYKAISYLGGLYVPAEVPVSETAEVLAHEDIVAE